MNRKYVIFSLIVMAGIVALAVYSYDHKPEAVPTTVEGAPASTGN